MYALILVVLLAVLAMRASRINSESPDDIPHLLGDKLGRLWSIAHVGLKENKFLRAEKALLTILANR